MVTPTETIAIPNYNPGITQGGESLTVLLIEQGRLSQAFLSRLFQSLGFRLAVANSNESAMHQLQKVQPALVCMNRYLDGMDAFEFAAEIRKAGYTAPLLLLTADERKPTKTKALNVGITEVIAKDSMPDLAERISCFVQEHVRPDLHRGWVLYVEDSRTESTVIIKLLKSMGLNVDHTTTAENAIELFDQSDKYDLVITDVLLQGEMSGLFVVRHIRKLTNDKSRIPVLTVTGFDQKARRIELLRAGTNDYIVKPVIKEELSVRVTNLISNKQLMDEVVRQQLLLHEMAITDQLTGCHNRHGFADITEKYMASSRRRKDDVSLLMLDLDYFKQINDTWGHDKGDLVLKKVGRALRDSCREGDVVSRMGGEEFVIFLPDCTKKSAIDMAQRIREKIESLKPGELDVTTSIGVTTIPSELKIDMDIALNAVDKAVYQAKKRGRNCVSFKACSRPKA